VKLMGLGLDQGVGLADDDRRRLQAPGLRALRDATWCSRSSAATATISPKMLIDEHAGTPTKLSLTCLPAEVPQPAAAVTSSLRYRRSPSAGVSRRRAWLPA
jgi:hypothetical protein